METVQTNLRNAELPDLVGLLKSQQDVRYDVVLSADRLSMTDGQLVIKDGTSAPTGINSDGSLAEAAADAILTPTAVCDGGMADRLNIPVKYLRRMRDSGKAALLDHNVNTWLADEPSKKWLVRGFLGEGATEGLARAFLSSSYGITDHLDLLLAALDGAKQSGARFDVLSADLTERRMRVRVACPDVAVNAPSLLAGYRSPFDAEVDEDSPRGQMLRNHGWIRPDDRPVVHAGFVIANSETGHGGWCIMPELVVKACTNGLTIKAEKVGGIHLGSRMEEGIVTFTEDTRRKEMELIKAQVRDAVAGFVTPAYVGDKVAELEVLAGRRVADPTSTLERVAKQFSFSDAEADAILSDFIAGGQVTAGGVMQAVTSVAQRVDDADRAGELNDAAVEVLAFAAAIAE